VEKKGSFVRAIENQLMQLNKKEHPFSFKRYALQSWLLKE